MRELIHSTNENDLPVMAYEIQGMAIHNPFLSSCGRFIVNPLATYGLTLSECVRLKTINNLIKGEL